MSSKPIEKPAPPAKEAEHAKKESGQDSGQNRADSHAAESPPTGGSKSPPPMEGHAETKPHAAETPRDSARDMPPLNQGRVHPEGHEPAPEPQKARLHMDQIDAVATSQGVVLFALTEGGEIWQLTTPGGQPVWNQILTPEAPAEDA